MPASPAQYQARPSIKHASPSFSPAAGELASPGGWPEQLQHQASLPATEDSAGTREGRGGSFLLCCSAFPGIPREGRGRKAMKYTRWRIYPGDSPGVSSPAIHPWGRRVLSFPAGQDSGRHSSGVHSGAFLQRAAGSGKGLNGPFCSPTSPQKACAPTFCCLIKNTCLEVHHPGQKMIEYQ